MTLRSTTRTPRSPRPRAAAVLLTFLAAIAWSLVPGSASAAAMGTITPLADCYAKNSDGTYTVVFGYTSSASKTVSIAVGSNNTLSPSKYNSALPTSFSSGTQHGVFKVTFTQAELNAGASWYVSGNELTMSNTGSIPVCSASQLPMLANGAAVVGLVVVAGVIGAVVVRRQRRQPGLELAGRG